MADISVTIAKGIVVKCDSEAWDRLKHIKWYLNGYGYVIGSVYHDGKQKNLALSREILLCPKGMMVDHIDGDPLNNVLSNLRIVNASQNMMNKKKKSTNSSGYKGVSRTWNGSWRAQIKANGKNIHLGYFPDPKQAHEKYKEAAIEYFGSFACFR